MAKSNVVALATEQTTNAGEEMLNLSIPYIVGVDRRRRRAASSFTDGTLRRSKTKSKAAKGSAAKKSDDTESYLYRNGDGEISLPGEYLRQSIITAAKFQQDPRSPRKSAMDLFKAAVISLTPLASLAQRSPTIWIGAGSWFSGTASRGRGRR